MTWSVLFLVVSGVLKEESTRKETTYNFFNKTGLSTSRTRMDESLQGVFGSDFFVALFGEGCSVRFHISLYLPRSMTRLLLRLFRWVLLLRERLCVSNARKFLLVYWERKFALLLS